MSGQLSRMINCVSVGYSTAEAAVEIDNATHHAEGYLFIGVVASTASRIPSLALKMGASTTSFVNCASTHTHASTAAGQFVVMTDVYKPAKRWVGATLTTSSATPSWLIALAYGMRQNSSNFTASGTNMPTATGGIKRVVSPSSAT